jgi:hypothetical protein
MGHAVGRPREVKTGTVACYGAGPVTFSIQGLCVKFAFGTFEARADMSFCIVFLGGLPLRHRLIST